MLGMSSGSILCFLHVPQEGGGRDLILRDPIIYEMPLLLSRDYAHGLKSLGRRTTTASPLSEQIVGENH